MFYIELSPFLKRWHISTVRAEKPVHHRGTREIIFNGEISAALWCYNMEMHRNDAPAQLLLQSVEESQHTLSFVFW